MGESNNSNLLYIVCVGLLAWAIAMTVLYVQEKDKNPEMSMSESDYTEPSTEELVFMLSADTSFEGNNTCAGADLGFPNIECFESLDDEGGNVTEGSPLLVPQVGPQAGTNVTAGYNGDMAMNGVLPITDAYYKKGLCPVNVHWHLGTEHYSAGEYDCADDTMCGPSGIHERRRLAGKLRLGFQCNLYDPEDEKFTTPYEWKFCDKDMEVGQTYEIHWPHSTAGACGTPNQYQTPFYDGVFCNLPMEVFTTLSPQDIANNVGVQGQVFTIVNDESYYYPNLIDGMIVDGEFGQDMAIYTGSTTGTKRNNEICSQYTPITWQVDRKCHLISASSFDKMCADMLSMRDDMSVDTAAQGSRELVIDSLAADNHMNLRA